MATAPTTRSRRSTAIARARPTTAATPNASAAALRTAAGVERGLQHAQRERAVREHRLAPRHGLDLELLEWHNLVHESHLECLLRVVLVAQEPDLARLLLPDAAGEEARAVAAVEGPDLWARLPEAGVVGGDGEVAHDVQ